MPLWQPFAAAAVAVPVVVVKGLLSARSRQPFDADIGTSDDGGAGGGDAFVCERVCASDRLLRRLGKLSKEPTRRTCTTVCGVSSHDACAEACQRAVCSNPHSVPAWNEACLKRCTAECLKGRAGGG